MHEQDHGLKFSCRIVHVVGRFQYQLFKLLEWLVVIQDFTSLGYMLESSTARSVNYWEEGYIQQSHANVARLP